MRLSMRQRKEADAAFRGWYRCVMRRERPGNADESAAHICVSVLLCEGRTGVVDAVREIICRRKPERTKVEGAVARFCIEHEVTANTVYKWIRDARELYMACRWPGMAVEEPEGQEGQEQDENEENKSRPRR